MIPVSMRSFRWAEVEVEEDRQWEVWSDCGEDE